MAIGSLFSQPSSEVRAFAGTLLNLSGYALP